MKIPVIPLEALELMGIVVIPYMALAIAWITWRLTAPLPKMGPLRFE